MPDYKITISFNTGRLYTRQGQRITATLSEDGVVTFHDHSRMIDGEIHGTVSPSEFNQMFVIRCYDRGEYKGTSRSNNDAFLSDGCNAKYQE